MRYLSDGNDEDIYESYRVFPDDIRDLRFGNYTNTGYLYCYHGVDKETFYKDRINLENLFRIKQPFIDRIRKKLTEIGDTRGLEPYHGDGIEVFLLGAPVDLGLCDENAKGVYNQIYTTIKYIVNLPPKLLNFTRIENLTYIDIDWDAVAKRRAKIANGIKIKIKLNPSININKHGKPTGSQYMILNHVDEDKIDTLSDFSFIYGDELCVCEFDSGKRISIYAKDKKEGVKAINKLMKAVIETKKKRIKVADLVPSNPKKDPHSLSGIKASFDGFKILNGDEDEC